MAGDAPTEALRHTAASRQRYVTELQEFVRIPSVSVEPRHGADVQRCAEWLRDHLRGVGLSQAELVATPRHPFVFAESRRIAGAPTLLIYGHYDVQPVDPVGEWRTPPFQPTIHGDSLFGRGASDNKGQLLAHVKGLEAYLRTAGRPPLNVICLFDGEEEIGSPHLKRVLECRPSMKKVDVALLSDTRMVGPDRPAITYGLRGALPLELEVRTAASDLHSGHFGGAIHNAVQALCEIVAKLHTPGGQIAVPGMYERVRRIGDEEREYLASTAATDREVRRNGRALALWGDSEFSAYERTTVRPALTVNGITGGYSGPGGKAVIPTRATAKLSVRLVPDQEPRAIAELLRRYIRRISPRTVRVRLRFGPGTRPYLVDPRHPYLRAAARACRRVFAQPAVFIRSGGSVPFSRTVADTLGVPVVLMGFALPDDQPHAPNEKFHLPTFFRAIDTSVWFLHELSRRREPGGDPGCCGRMRRAAWRP